MNNKIEELRGKLKEKKQMDENPCPTGILFYLATGRQYFQEVNPWYNQIKQLAEGANRHDKEHHEAVIYGMYPELEEACKYFNEEFKAYFENHETCPEAEAHKIENNTIKKFNLKSKYSLLNPTEEQKKQIAINQEKAFNIEFNKNMQNKSPIVKMLGYGLKDNVSDINNLVVDMSFLNTLLKQGPVWLKENASGFPEYAELFVMADKIFDLQKQGAISKNFEIKDFNKIKQSSLVQDMQYEGKSINIADKIKNPHLTMNVAGKDYLS